MLRAFFIWLSKAQWAQRLISRWGFAWQMASRFVAGETAAQAIAAVRQLNAQGINATLDHLGEHTANAEAAEQSAAEIIAMLEEINREGVRANVSIKLSQIGLTLDETLCRNLLWRILQRARQLNNFIRIDMEDSSLTERTLNLLRAAHAEGDTHCGIVIQAYLLRSAEDIRQLAAAGIPVRLCKGAYQEPAAVAYPRKADVDDNYDRLADALLTQAGFPNTQPLSADGRFPPLAALATHDPRRIEHARATIKRLALPNGAMEFQMLYGIRRDLQQELATAGYPVRVYVPYGTHWYPYFMRRLAERPANLWFFVSNFFHK
jgi:proline dehydrogenase